MADHWLNIRGLFKYLISMENLRVLCYIIKCHGPLSELSSLNIPDKVVQQEAWQDLCLPFSLLRFPVIYDESAFPVFLSVGSLHAPQMSFVLTLEMWVVYGYYLKEWFYLKKQCPRDSFYGWIIFFVSFKVWHVEKNHV